MDHTISEVARAFGIRVSALRYYDELGLLRPAGRRATVRTYGRDELRRLALIQLLHRDGLMSLSDTAAVLADPPPHDRTLGRRVLAESLHAMREQMNRLAEAQRVLDHVLTCPRDDPARDCPVLRENLENAVDAALGSRAESRVSSEAPESR
ncbi:MerR family transcriptional regulator [Nocardia sp. NPDC004068]|uniref:MerR family transcriptional regulator n=1 Tax=Nocardia sp. NPDC004068 TaxID=3364303 RepID=UPI0036A81F99